MRDLRDYSLLEHNTFGIEARCRRFLEFDSVEEAVRMVHSLSGADEPLLVIGGGSNLLLTQDYQGTVLHSAIKGVEATHDPDGEHVYLRCGSGEVFDEVVSYAVSHGYHGLENLSAIPGEVGASAVQNIGAYGVEAKDVLHEIEAVEIATGKLVAFRQEECDYAYRKSKFKTAWKGRFLITYVTYRLSRDFRPRLDYGNIRGALQAQAIEQPTARQLRKTICAIRASKLPDPKVLGNAGSFFVNPVVDEAKWRSLSERYPGMPYYVVSGEKGEYKIPAGWMIEQCGWKGKSLGPAGVHDKQALVLVNKGGATGKDVLQLCERIRNDVRRRFGVEIYPEVNIL